MGHGQPQHPLYPSSEDLFSPLEAKGKTSGYEALQLGPTPTVRRAAFPRSAFAHIRPTFSGDMLAHDHRGLFLARASDTPR